MAQKSVLETALADKASIEADLAAARAALDTLRTEQQAREQTIRDLEAKLARAEAAETSLRKQSGDMNGLLQTLTSAAESATKKIREETDAEIAALRAELAAARREAAAAKSGTAGDDRGDQPSAGDAGGIGPCDRGPRESSKRRGSLLDVRPPARAAVPARRALPHEGQAPRRRTRIRPRHQHRHHQAGDPDEHGLADHPRREPRHGRGPRPAASVDAAIRRSAAYPPPRSRCRSASREKRSPSSMPTRKRRGSRRTRHSRRCSCSTPKCC